MCFQVSAVVLQRVAPDVALTAAMDNDVVAVEFDVIDGEQT
jgi:hypothetical protein